MLQFFAKRLKQLHEVKKDERGFTLIELIVVASKHHSSADAAVHLSFSG